MTQGEEAGRVCLVRVQDEPLSSGEILDAVAAPGVGGIVTFTGIVRDHADGRGVTALEYSAHPSAAEVLRTVAREVANRPGVRTVAVAHRTGHLQIGDLAVVLAVGAAHRGTAFEASRVFIDTLKQRVPIWKHQIFDDGTDEWVGTP